MYRSSIRCLGLVSLLGFFFLTTAVNAANPSAPFSPSDNVQDPGNPSSLWGGCGPSDSNCFVQTIPGQTGNGGKFLTTNGTTMSWGAVNTIYTSDGSLTGNRAVDLAGNTLGFTGGSVGIGTVTPQDKLDVSGNINLLNDGADRYIRSVRATVGQGSNMFISAGNGVSALLAGSGGNLNLNGGNGGGGSDTGGNININAGTGSTHGNILLGNSTGNVSIGSTTATSLFNVGSSAQFQINSAGVISAAAGITSSGTINFSSLASSSMVFTDSLGNLTTTSPTSTIGYWTKSGSTLSPESSSDVVSVTGSGGVSNLFSVTSPSGANDNKVLNISQTGATQGIDYAGYFSNTGGSAANVAIYATATGANGGNNYAIIVPSGGGSVGIGNTTPAFLLHVGSSATTTGTAVARFENAGGTCTITPSTAGGITCTSDQRLKKNINALNNDILAKILNVRLITYNLNAELDTDPVHTGVLAQELEQIFPDLVQTDSLGYKSVSYVGLVPYTIKAIQEMNIQVKGLSSLDTADPSSLGSLIKKFLGDVANGIGDLYATVVHSNKSSTKQLCITDDSGAETCITKSQLDSLLQNSNTTSAPSTPADTTNLPSIVTSPIMPADTTSTPTTDLSPQTDSTSLVNKQL